LVYDEARLLMLEARLRARWGQDVDSESVQRAQDVLAGLGVRRDRQDQNG
jgi:hypothetical protein